MDSNERIKEIDKDILELNKKELGVTDALIYAKLTVRKISDVLGEGVDITTRLSLYEKAARVYGLALKSIPEKEKHNYEFPSEEYFYLDEMKTGFDYWSITAKNLRPTVKKIQEIRSEGLSILKGTVDSSAR